MENIVYTEDNRENEQISEQQQLLIEKVVNRALEYEKVEKPCFVSVSIVEPEEIQSLNREHRGIDSVTDVLSFPVLEFADGKMIENSGDFYEGRIILGDVVICAQRAMEQSREYGHTFEREVGYLTCHSILHLLGYDHETEDEKKVMREKEEAVLSLIQLNR